MKTLITGATGFVGSNICKLMKNKRLVVRNEKAVAHDDLFVVDTIDKRTDWSGAFNQIDAVVHLAGLAHNKSRSDDDYYDINFKGTINLASAASKAGVKRFVFISSIGVNGSVSEDGPFTHESTPNPHNHYAKSKYLAEKNLMKLAEDSHLEVVIIRPTLVYGPSAPGNFSLLVNLVKKFPILPFGMVKNKRDFISVDNLVDLILRCITHPRAPGNIFLASDGVSISTREFIDQIANGLGKKILHLPIPAIIMKLIMKLIRMGNSSQQLFGDLEVDSSNCSEVLGWTPPYKAEKTMVKLRRINNV